MQNTIAEHNAGDNVSPAPTPTTGPRFKLRTPVRFTVPSVRRIRTLVRDMEKPPVVTRYPSGRVQSVCGLGIGEFTQLAGVTYATWHRLTNRRAHERVMTRIDTIQKVANAINLILGNEVATTTWVIQNLCISSVRLSPDEHIRPTQRQSMRNAMLAQAHALKALDIIAKYNDGSIENIVKRHMNDPLTADAVIAQVHEELKAEAARDAVTTFDTGHKLR